MIPSLTHEPTFYGDDVLDFPITKAELNMLGYDLYTDFSIPATLDYIKHFNHHLLASDGYEGIVADNLPSDGTVVILQVHGDRYMEVGRAATTTGEWQITNLRPSQSLAVAIKEGYNAGIVGGLIPVE